MLKKNLYSMFINKSEDGPIKRSVLIFNYILIIGIGVGILLFGFNKLDYNLRWDSVYKYKDNLFDGFITTIIISFLSLIFSTILGLFFGLASRSWFTPLKVLSRVYVEIIRGTPLLVQILIFFYVIANAIGLNNRFVAGVVIMALFSGAYIAEIIRAGIESVSATQRETAKAIGLTKNQTYRYIILPQVITRVLPPLAGQFASLVKDSSLLSIISISEFTMAAREVNANTFSTLESYIPLAIGYLLLTIPISILTQRLERKYKYET